MITRLSNIYRPLSIIPKDAVIKHQDINCRSQRLMLELGLLKSAGNGTFYILPMGQRALDKCINLVNECMATINAQKVNLPILTNATLWKKSGRYDDCATELLIAKDRQGKSFILSPTHEESIVSLIALSSPLSYKQLPLKLYQIGSKFRDELKPRFGLLRTKEFIMKDLYTFDISKANAENTYFNVNEAYRILFEKLQLPCIKVQGSTGIMGGLMSHEYHILSTIGEDDIINCTNCNFSSNEEVTGKIANCPKCGKSNLHWRKGIEIAHTFALDDKYSKSLGATFLQSNGKPKNLFMGCFGIGMTRLLAASLELFSTENELKWPLALAPFSVCLIPPKEGSNEEKAGEQWISRIIPEMKKICGEDAIILDDRKSMTIGKRLLDAKRMGYPIVIVVGSKAAQEDVKFELHCAYSNSTRDVGFSELFTEMAAILS